MKLILIVIGLVLLFFATFQGKLLADNRVGWLNLEAAGIFFVVLSTLVS